MKGSLCNEKIFVQTSNNVGICTEKTLDIYLNKGSLESWHYVRRDSLFRLPEAVPK
jgi:hypothetical protein